MLVEVLLALAAVLAGVAKVWLLLTLPIDIMAPIATAGIRVIGRNSKNLRRILFSAGTQRTSRCWVPRLPQNARY
jgi:hypothetical protein